MLAVVFRKKDYKNIYMGGPYYYIKYGLGNKRLAIIYAITILIAYTCGFTPIQVNTVTSCITNLINIPPIIIGIIIGLFTTSIIIGGVKKIATITSKVVPFMATLYFIMSFIVIAKNYTMIPSIIREIFNSAFNIKTFGIGVISTLIIGMQKGIFSSELGLGTGSISAATADTKYPAESGMVQTFGIHFENLFIATITTLVICMSNYQSLIIKDPNGVEITLNSFSEHLGNAGVMLTTVIITLFGISTVFTSYYYGESSLKFIKKANKIDILILKLITIAMLVLASVATSKVVWTITDIIVGLLAIINIYSIYKLKDIVIEEYEIYRKNNK